MFPRRSLTRTNLATALLVAAALLTSAGSPAHAQPPGIKAVFIGHSFFRPFADEMPFHATQAGIVGHTQNVVFRGGPNGAPEALWNDPVTRALIQGYLDAGDVEVFGMTAHSDYPTLTGFINWFDYALAQNPNTRFMLALPWLPYPASYTAADYDSAWHAIHTGPWHHDLVDALRALYPGVEIFCNPYGQSGPELRLLFDAGNLPGITAVQGPAATSLHTDNLGHAGDILKDLGELVWLNRIYDIDLLTYSYSPPWATDLNAIAQAIMDAHNPCGNGLPDALEQCDDGNDNGTSRSCCTVDCQFEPNGAVSSGCDGEVCTTADICTDGVCSSGTCRNDQTCTFCGGTCSDASGSCVCEF